MVTSEICALAFISLVTSTEWPVDSKGHQPAASSQYQMCDPRPPRQQVQPSLSETEAERGGESGAAGSDSTVSGLVYFTLVHSFQQRFDGTIVTDV